METLPDTYGGDTDFDGRSILILPTSRGHGGYAFRLPDSGTEGLVVESWPTDGFPVSLRGVLRLGRLFRGRHALEHRVIHVLHAGSPATPESIRAASPYTLKCGSVVGLCFIAGLVPLAFGIVLWYPWLGLAGEALFVLAAFGVRRWQACWSPLAVAGTRLARVLNAPFAAADVTDDDCVLGAEMVRRVREAAGTPPMETGVSA